MAPVHVSINGSWCVIRVHKASLAHPTVSTGVQFPPLKPTFL